MLHCNHVNGNGTDGRTLVTDKSVHNVSSCPSAVWRTGSEALRTAEMADTDTESPVNSVHHWQGRNTGEVGSKTNIADYLSSRAV